MAPGKTCGLFQLDTDMLTAVRAIARVAQGLPSGNKLPIAYIVPIMTVVPARMTATAVVSTISLNSDWKLIRDVMAPRTRARARNQNWQVFDIVSEWM